MFSCSKTPGLSGARWPSGKDGQSLCPSAGCSLTPGPGLHPRPGWPAPPPHPPLALSSQARLHQERRASGAQTPLVSQWGLQAQRATSWIPVFWRCWGGGRLCPRARTWQVGVSCLASDAAPGVRVSIHGPGEGLSTNWQPHPDKQNSLSAAIWQYSFSILLQT